MFTTKELLLRVETTLNTKMDVMRQEMINQQANMATKDELSTHITVINRDLERQDRKIESIRDEWEARLKEYREEARKDLAEFKADIHLSNTKLISILGVVIALIQVGLHFL